ncbi:MAG: hypothetical protein JWP35_2946 [Caulobacter sp.]|nr:hypothetical protein [Caulobacter sp.]
MTDGQFAEVIVLADDNPPLGHGDLDDRSVGRPGVRFEHMGDVVAGVTQRRDDRRGAAFIGQQPHYSAATKPSWER